MKLSIILLSIFILNCSGLILDNCQTNADCPNGCCMAGLLGLGHSCHSYLTLHHSCHLNGQESLNCGCAPGTKCVSTSSGSHTIGHCEKDDGTASTTSAPTTAETPA